MIENIFKYFAKKHASFHQNGGLGTRPFIYLILLITLVAQSGCNKYLETLPDQRAVINTPEKASQLLISGYPGVNDLVTLEALTYNAGFRSDKGNYDTARIQLYRFKDYVGTTDFIWNGYYASVAVANEVLKVIEKAANAQDYSAQKGEALMIRAYSHFQLVNLYAKAYDAATAATDLGVPFVDEPEDVLQKKYKRQTVQENFDRIEADMIEALKLIRDEGYKNSAYRFTRKAAFAFATTFYLTKKNYEKVLYYGDLAFPGLDFSNALRPFNTVYRDALGVPYHYASGTERANLLITSISALTTSAFLAERYGLNPSIRGQLYYNPGPANVTRWAFQFTTSWIDSKNVTESKYFLKEVYLGGGYANYYTIVPRITSEDVLFNVAEAFIQTQQFGRVLPLFNMYLSTRVMEYDPAVNTLTLEKIRNYYKSDASVSDDKGYFMKQLLWFKRMEFMQSGKSWYDIKRLDLPVEHIDEQGQKFILEPGSPMRQLLIPERAVYLEGLIQNPR